MSWLSWLQASLASVRESSNVFFLFTPWPVSVSPQCLIQSCSSTSSVPPAAESNSTTTPAPTSTPVNVTAAPTAPAKQTVIMHPVGAFSRDPNPFPSAPTLVPGGFAPVIDETPAHNSFPRAVPSSVTLSGVQARGILRSLYGGTSPRRIYKVLNALPPSTRRALLHVIKRTRSPSARVTIASSFLSTYAEASAEADPAVLLETATAAATEAAAKAEAETGAEAEAEAEADEEGEADAEEEGEADADAEEATAASFIEIESPAEDAAFLEVSAAAEAEAAADAELDADAEAEEQLHAEAEVAAEEEADADADADEEGEADAEAEQELENAADSDNTVEEAMFEKMAEVAQALSFVESLSEAEQEQELEQEQEQEAEAEAEMDVEHAVAKAVSDGGVKALTGLAAALAQQSNALELKIRQLENERKQNPTVFDRADRGPVGRRPTNPKDRFPDTGLRSWEAEARNDVMRQSPIRPDQAASYFGVEPLPTGF